MTKLQGPELARFIVGIVGNITSFFLFGSPIPTFWRIWKNKSVEEFKFHPYVAAIMNCMFWIFYGAPIVHPDSTLVITINSIGLVLEVAYTIIYFTYTDKKKRMQVILFLLGELMIFAILASVTLKVFHTHKARSNFVGAFCVVFGIILYSSPLTVMVKVIKTKSVEFMPFFLSLAAFSNGLVWAVYALIKFDLYILIGNGIGALLGAAQLILYAIYYKTTPRGGNDVEKPSQVQMSTGAYRGSGAVA
ncbi:hypothetical protein Ancab_003990 [Ancistrocladus abbreviatus]